MLHRQELRVARLATGARVAQRVALLGQRVDPLLKRAELRVVLRLAAGVCVAQLVELGDQRDHRIGGEVRGRAAGPQAGLGGLVARRRPPHPSQLALRRSRLHQQPGEESDLAVTRGGDRAGCRRIVRPLLGDGAEGGDLVGVRFGALLQAEQLQRQIVPALTVLSLVRLDRRGLGVTPGLDPLVAGVGTRLRGLVAPICYDPEVVFVLHDHEDLVDPW